MIDYLLVSLGLVPALATRVFTPLFFSLLFARLGPQYAWIARLEGVEVFSHVPAVLVTDSALGICLVLMILELAADKSPEIREIMGLFDSKAKAVAAVAICTALAGGGAVATAALGPAAIPAPFPVASLGGAYPLAYAWAVLIGFLVWLTAVLRRGLFNALADLDPDDDLGLARLLSWAEDFFGLFFFLLVVALPIVAVAMAGSAVLALWLVRKILEAREQGQKVACPSCGAANAPCGVACGKCGQIRADVRRIGPLGGIRNDRVTDLRLHYFELLGRKRCPWCGDRLQDRKMGEPCAGCRRPPFATSAEAESYLAWISGKLPRTLGILLLCSCVPLLGLVPGIIYYRISLISSLRAYLPFSISFFGRWVVRLINLFLLCLQPVPLLGMVVLPLMCLTNFYFYRSLLRGQVAGQLRSPPLPVPGQA